MKTLAAVFLLFAALDARAASVPNALAKVESLAEDIYDKALDGDPASANAQTVALTAQWKAYRPQAKKDGAQDPLLASEDRAVAALKTSLAANASPTKTARAANSVSTQMETLFSLYHPAAPPGLMTLDFLGRELTLDAREGNFNLAAAHLEWMRRAWTGLKPSAVAAGGEGAASFETAVADAKKAREGKDASGLERAARACLKAVDVIEDAFVPKEAPAAAPEPKP